MGDEKKNRVNNSQKVIGHAHYIGWANSDMEDADKAKEELPVLEGEHYEVLSHTLWADYHQPVTVRWNHGEVDDFTDLEESLENREKAIEENEDKQGKN